MDRAEGPDRTGGSMTRDQIIERVKALMHLGDRSGLSPTDEAFLGDIATAIVDMLGPKELEWGKVDGAWISDGYEIDAGIAFFQLFAEIYDGVDSRADFIGSYGDLEAAKAAAQAHHEEQHWKRTGIWEA